MPTPFWRIKYLTRLRQRFKIIFSEEEVKEEIKNPKILDFIEKGNQSILDIIKKVDEVKDIKDRWEKIEKNFFTSDEYF